ncbi:nitrate reductase cytochrome c-type subunit [Enterobacter cancerogenus]|uniref:nitrate reductase cytochrome c-type subunit n=1 Tax=Enterobacter cancerogenus TaxID=69218 RepID=UPI000537AB32|nr:nitrate reductase cytochrome c-type subunit [Enterobacter cancerogenus]KGT90223.1 nitrate reductase [Enterobacter cancerogenus]
MKPLFTLITVAALTLGGVVYAGHDVDLTQSPEVTATQQGTIHQPKEQSRKPLNYVNQPPVIPHSVDGYQVTKNVNRCLQCHGTQSYLTTGAPRVSPTHFTDRDGLVSSTVSPRRYFCLQCHVPQTDAKPVVENTFKPANGFGQ